MKLVQFHLPGVGKRFGVVKGKMVWDLTDHYPTCYDAVLEALRRNQTLDALLTPCLSAIRRKKTAAVPLEELLRTPSPEKPHLLLPIDPPEVWGAGVTYKRSALGRDADSQTDIYTRVYFSDRPEIFFKATASRCSPPYGPIGIRSDSQFTAPEAEVAILIGESLTPLAYTLCNDVSAWDIERENPLYLPQSKTFLWCCSFGPWLVTADQVPDPTQIPFTCRIRRNGTILFEAKASTRQMNRTFQDLLSFLLRNNPVPPGSLLTTGTGIMMGEEAALRDGDIVEIESRLLGLLVNRATKLPET
ncbi:MAG: fumarylacetoacetate hydrolase family protein [Armatimonadetes bacterium]|nr:fumarylacetoacetate hydrolase family protein [Armatimonadota bacterium]MDW8122385.1 fumarylacetoacetate hydrolase family protein [Armatimonadota bacterium]